MSSADLLLEIGTEELPPQSLKTLASAFADGILQGLAAAGLAHGDSRWYATPRRLALRVQDLDIAQPDREVEKLGPAIAACYDADGQPTPALRGFAQSCGVAPEALETRQTDKGERIAFTRVEHGQPTSELLEGILDTAIRGLPIARRMRWGDQDAEFVRPVHWLVALLDEDVVPITALGVEADRLTYGHRFMSPDEIALEHPEEYESALGEAHVIVDYAERRIRIQTQVQQAAMEAGGQALISEDLLDEVTALVEWPVAVSGHFDEDFLRLPREVLIAVMQDHQRYFAVEGSDDRLLPAFVTVANIDSIDSAQVSRGNERVIRPRFADAMFFWEQDLKRPLADFNQDLERVTHQRKLGTIADRSARIVDISKHIAADLGLPSEAVTRAATLAKADLMTQMVYEFTELQGTMGRYYAAAAGEPAEVAQALEEQYLPRYSGDRLPASETGLVLSLADKLDLIAGIFSAGMKPTGSRDPYALRRAALGVLRILIEKELDLDLHGLIAFAASVQPPSLESTEEDVCSFFAERLRGLLGADHGAQEVEAVLAVSANRPWQAQRRLAALEVFLASDDAPSLCAAHKRCANILRSASDIDVPPAVEEAKLVDPPEKVLCALYETVSGKVQEATDRQDYAEALNAMLRLREPLDEYFEQVMVMHEDLQLRRNRLAQLAMIDRLFAQVADLGLVSADRSSGDAATA